MPAKYRVHHYDIRMTAVQSKLEQFLNSLEGEIVTIIPQRHPVPKRYACGLSPHRRETDLI